MCGRHTETALQRSFHLAAEAEDEAAPTPVVQIPGSLCCQRRRAGEGDGDVCADIDLRSGRKRRRTEQVRLPANIRDPDCLRASSLGLLREALRQRHVDATGQDDSGPAVTERHFR